MHTGTFMNAPQKKAGPMKLSDLVGKKITSIKRTAYNYGLEICLDDEFALEIVSVPDEQTVDITVAQFRYQREQIGKAQKITE